jgi:predicted nucleic acid-binding protein
VNYPDTSFLLPLYMPEPSSSRVRDYVAQLDEPLIYTPFHRLETRTAIRTRSFREGVSVAAVRAIFRKIDSTLEEDILRHAPLDWNAALREAENVAQAHVMQMGANSADLLHVACALVLDAEEFLTFDQRQAVLAKRAGLNVKAWRWR